jgi:hypothetical protein
MGLPDSTALDLLLNQGSIKRYFVHEMLWNTPKFIRNKWRRTKYHNSVWFCSSSGWFHSYKMMSRRKTVYCHPPAKFAYTAGPFSLLCLRACGRRLYYNSFFLCLVLTVFCFLFWWWCWWPVALLGLLAAGASNHNGCPCKQVWS